ncbi:MAG: polynucleotide adenylyltransferase PcnB [Planctomycetes bacterium]|nr:polynucleotide adenylyltransferase PcnB [Planctomycetota bacterium]
MEPNSAPPTQNEPGSGPRIIPRSQHSISRQNISDETLKVLYRLHSLGYKAYLVGGGVRDLYLGKTPKDFDIGTDAPPGRLRKIFRNCRIIGRRFRIAHVYFPGNKIVEVATFRRGEVHTIHKPSGVVLIDNQYGTPEEDAKRRDLTINGLFYDIGTYSIIDYVGGVEDLEKRVIRTIKDPDASFREDPVRMVRALRHAARTSFHIEENTYQSIQRNRQELLKANPSRLMEEVYKDLRGGAAGPFFRKMLDGHLLETFLPTLARQLQEMGEAHVLWRRLQALDRLVCAGREFANPVLISLLLHTQLISDPSAWQLTQNGASHPKGVWNMMQHGFQEAGRHMRISRRDREKAVQILLAFLKLSQFVKRRELSPAYQKKSYLGSALDFLEVDLESRGEDSAVIHEWRERYAPEPAETALEGAAPEGFEEGAPARPSRRGRRRRRRGRGAAGSGAWAAAGSQTHPAPAHPHSGKSGRRQSRRRRGRRHRSPLGHPQGLDPSASKE